MKTVLALLAALLLAIPASAQTLAITGGTVVIRNGCVLAAYGGQTSDALLNRVDAAALVPVVQGRVPLIARVEQARDILNVIGLGEDYIAARGDNEAGRRDRLPSAERRADVAIRDDDPLELTSNVDMMLIDGARQSLTSHQTRLWDRYLSAIVSGLRVVKTR